MPTNPNFRLYVQLSALSLNNCVILRDHQKITKTAADTAPITNVLQFVGEHRYKDKVFFRNQS